MDAATEQEIEMSADQDRLADQWMMDYCDGKKPGEFNAHVTLLQQCEAIRHTSWMTPAPVRAKPSLLTRVFRFFGV